MTRNNKGFTMIEMLVVLVIMGVLAAFAVNGYSESITKAHVASMRSDLKDLVTSEAAYFTDSMTYTSVMQPTPTPGAVTFIPTQGNSIAITLDTDGWHAVASRTDLTTQCTVYIGPAPILPATRPGAVACAG